MIAYRNRIKTLKTIILLGAVLFISGLWAQNSNLPWLQYQQAATFYKDRAPLSQVIDLLQQVQRTSKDSVLLGRCLLLSASAYERGLQYDKALLELKKLELPGKNYLKTMQSEAWLRTGNIFLNQNKVGYAQKYFDKVVEANNNPFQKNEAILGLAWISADENKSETCDSLLSLINSDTTSGSRDERVLILNTRKLIANEQYQEAIKLVEKSETESGLYYLARANELAGNRIMAVSVYKKLHDMFPGTPEAQLALFQAAEVFMRAGDWLAARSEFKRLMQSGLQHADGIHFRLGWIYMNLNQLEEALAEFRFQPSAENSGYFKYMEA